MYVDLTDSTSSSAVSTPAGGGGGVRRYTLDSETSDDEPTTVSTRPKEKVRYVTIPYIHIHKRQLPFLLLEVTKSSWFQPVLIFICSKGEKQVAELKPANCPGKSKRVKSFAS